MQAEYTEGRISFDLHALLEMIPAEQKESMAESLSCDDAVISFVAQQIIQKWTDNGYHGSVSCTAAPVPCRGLDKAWRDVAKASGEIAAREIGRLEKALSASKEAYYNLADELAQVRRHV